MSAHSSTEPARRRVRWALVGLAAVWAVSFTVPALPFFPTVLVGGAAAALAGRWVRAALVAPPPLRAPRRWWLVAVVVAAAHDLLGRLWWWALPGWRTAASAGLAPLWARLDAAPLWLRLLAAGALTAPMEEYLWRGAVQPTLGGVVGTAVTYAAFHVVTLQPTLVAAALFGGLVWGWLAQRSGAVGPAALAHALWTASVLAFPPL